MQRVLLGVIVGATLAVAAWCRRQFAPSYLCPPWLSDFVLLDCGSIAVNGTTEEVSTPGALEPHLRGRGSPPLR